MGAEQIRRWESGALAHAVSDPFGQGPLPWLRGSENYFDDTGQVVPWYADLGRGTGGGTRTADDVRRQIKGFVSPGAAAPGEAIDFHITVDPPQQFSVDVYRIGHYGGDGAAKITTSPRALRHRPAADRWPPTRTVACHHWWMSWRHQIPSYWSVCAYVADLTTADGYRAHIPFAVRHDRPADLPLLLPDITWQAYNRYPEDGRTGASLYHAWDDRGRLLGEADAAVTVSVDRPYAGAGLPAASSGTRTTQPWPNVATTSPRLGKVALYQLSYVRTAPKRAAYYTQPRSRARRTAVCRFSAPILEAAEDR
ncbi:hypothetical protein SMICM17S_08187 [Streptomyces microflavus]